MDKHFWNIVEHTGRHVFNFVWRDHCILYYNIITTARAYVGAGHGMGMPLLPPKSDLLAFQLLISTYIQVYMYSFLEFNMYTRKDHRQMLVQL